MAVKMIMMMMMLAVKMIMMNTKIIMTRRWMTRQSMLSERQIDMVFQRFDTDGDGNLNFKEFKT